jgi:hypothetical protein
VFHETEKGDDVSFGVDKDRRSSSAFIPEGDRVAKCLLKRMRSLLGNGQHESIEYSQLIKYSGGEHFRPHLDTIDGEKAYKFHPDYPKRPWNRLLTALVYLGDNCTGGETYFPRVTGVGAGADIAVPKEKVGLAEVRRWRWSCSFQSCHRVESWRYISSNSGCNRAGKALSIAYSVSRTRGWWPALVVIILTGSRAAFSL